MFIALSKINKTIDKRERKKDLIPVDLKYFLGCKFTCVSLVLAILAKSVIIFKIGLINISKR